MIKRLIVALMAVFVLAMALKAQPYAGGGIGLNINKVVIMGDMHFGYRLTGKSGIFFQGGYLAHVNNHDPAIFYYGGGKCVRIGILNHVEIGAGYSHSLISNENKALNKSGGILYAALVEEFGIGEITYGFHYIKDNLIPSITLRILFSND